jgi:hypothetical protein
VKKGIGDPYACGSKLHTSFTYQQSPLVTAVVRAGQGGRDVAVAPALLHSEVGGADRHRPGAILQAREHEEVPEEVPMGTNP